jgi:hypothetical protein
MMASGAALPSDKDMIELAIFDIDGPVTHPESRKIEQPEILDLTLDFMANDGYVAYNTGRASVIAHRRVIAPLLLRAQARGLDPGAASRRIAIFAEKGGVTGSVALVDRSGPETGWMTSSGSSSVFAGFRFPREVIAVAVRWYLRYGLSYRDVEELLAERGVTVDHVTVYRWVQRFTPEFNRGSATGSSCSR